MPAANRYNPRARTNRPRPDDDDDRMTTPAPPREAQDEQEDAVAREIRARAEERAADHWHVWRCPAGHVFETHRTTSDPARATTTPCVICRRDATYETPHQTAQREWDDEHTPLALMRAWAETLTDWAQTQLNAQTWTQRSRQQRLAAHRRQQTQQQDSGHATASADIFPPDF